MADSDNKTKVEESLAEAEDLNVSGSLSVEDLDAVIASEDPDFVKSIEGLSADGPLQVVEDDGFALKFTLEDEERRWQEATGVKAKLLKVFPFLPRLSFWHRNKMTAWRLARARFTEQFIRGLKNLGPALKVGIKTVGSALSGSLSQGLQTFKGYSLKKKLLFVGLLIFSIGAFGLIFRMTTQGLLPAKEDLFLGSLTEWAAEKYSYVPGEDMESFYESTRSSQNILLLKRLVVNLRRSADSGANPMAALEFLVEGTVSEVVVEVKDREAEVLDLFLRTIEEMTYDQVSSGEGKRLLCDRLRKEVNKILTKGHVRRIFIKNAVIKP